MSLLRKTNYNAEKKPYMHVKRLIDLDQDFFLKPLIE